VISCGGVSNGVGDATADETSDDGDDRRDGSETLLLIGEASGLAKFTFSIGSCILRILIIFHL